MAERRVSFEGRTLVVPQDASPDEIEQLFSAAPAAQTAPQHESMPWSEVGLQAAGNFVPSLLKFGEDVYGAVRHPIKTGETLYGVASGGLDNVDNYIRSKTGVPLIPENDNTKAANAVGAEYSKNYGSVEGFKEHLASDPVGALSDVAIPFTAGGAALAKAPSYAGKIAKLAGATGKALNPIRALDTAGKIIEPIVSNTIGGLGTRTGAESLRAAARAGREGGAAGETFLSNLRPGGASMESVVDDAKAAVSNMRRVRGEQYRKSMEGIKADQTPLNFAPIDKAWNDVRGMNEVKGHKINARSDVEQKITEALNEWRSDPGVHTAEGLDGLKQRIHTIAEGEDFNTRGRAMAEGVANAVKSEIVKQAPTYAKTMQEYEVASDLIREIERSLSIGKRASADTALRKLQSVMRNNTNTNYGNRIDTVRTLDRAGNGLIEPALAGQALNSWTPRGLGATPAAMTAGAAAYLHNPLLAGALPFMSPRLMGEASYYAGKVSRAIPNPKASIKGINSASTPTLIGTKAEQATGQSYADKIRSLSRH